MTSVMDPVLNLASTCDDNTGHDKCDGSSDTSLYLRSIMNVLNKCHFIYSQIPEREQNLGKSLLISCTVKCTATNFVEFLCYHLISLLSFLHV